MSDVYGDVVGLVRRLANEGELVEEFANWSKLDLVEEYTPVCRYFGARPDTHSVLEQRYR
jgi:hypothetical protein